MDSNLEFVILAFFIFRPELIMWYQRNAETIILNIYVQPGAKQSEIAGFHADALKIRLNAPPIEGRANEALLKFIAQLFAVPKRQVTLKRGDKSRHKTVVISGSDVEPEEILNRST